MFRRGLLLFFIDGFMFSIFYNSFTYFFTADLLGDFFYGDLTNGDLMISYLTFSLFIFDCK